MSFCIYETIDLVEDREWTTEIKVLVCEGPTQEKWKLCCLHPSTRDDEMSIIAAIFPMDQIFKDQLGYKLIHRCAVQRLKITAVNDPRVVYQYIIEVQAPTFTEQETVDFSNLLLSKKFSDVTLSVNGAKIYAHKIILANRSPVFDAMFTHRMSETELNKVQIKDISYITVRDFLYYLYTGKLVDDSTNDVFSRFSNLLVAADKYCVESLKTMCEEKLPLYLNIENVFDCLLLADTHAAVNLKKEVIDFIVRNAEVIIELPSYKNFLGLHADLSVEIVRALVEKTKSKKENSNQ